MTLQTDGVIFCVALGMLKADFDRFATQLGDAVKQQLKLQPGRGPLFPFPTVIAVFDPAIFDKKAPKLPKEQNVAAPILRAEDMRPATSLYFESPKLIVWSPTKQLDAFDCLVELMMDEVVNKEKLIAKESGTVRGLLRSTKFVQRAQYLQKFPPEVGLPEKIKSVIGITLLDLSENEITSMPSTIELLINLTDLSLRHNRIDAVPPELASLTKLERLDLSYNLISSFPSMERVSSLRQLVLNHNHLVSMPPQLDRLPKLELLDVAANKLGDTCWPRNLEWAKLSALEKLDLGDNALDALPAGISSLPALRELRVEGNKLDTVPPALTKPGATAELLQYLSELAKQGVTWKQVKLLIVGQEGVGKTSLVRLFKPERQMELMKNGAPVSTDGIWISPWTPKGSDVSFSVYDFGGQEVFYPTHQFFLTDRSVYIVVFKLTEAAYLVRVEYWLRQIKLAIGPDSTAPILLVGTHADACTPEVATTVFSNIQRHIGPQFQRSVRSDHYFAVSCKTKKNIPELMTKVLQVSQGQLLPIPGSYEALINKVKRIRESWTKDTPPIKSWAEWAAVCSVCRIPPDGMVAATRFLHDVGEVIFFRDPSLRDTLIFEPQWLADVMASLISVKGRFVAAKQGVLMHSNLPVIWAQWPTRIHQQLLLMLERFCVLHPLQEPDGTVIKCLIPCLLPEVTIAPSWTLLREAMDVQWFLERHYVFKFVPLDMDTGWFPRLLMRLMQYLPNVNVTQYSKNFALFVAEGKTQRGLLYYNPNSSRLVIMVASAVFLYREKMFSAFIEHTEALLRTFYENMLDDVDREAICSHCLANGVYYPQATSFPVVDLITKFAEGEQNVSCQQVVPMRIDYIAPDISLKQLPIIPEVRISIEKEIGRGAFGVVFKGTLGSQPVAIKQLTITKDDDTADLIQKFQEFGAEAVVMSRLSHHNLVRFFGITMRPKWQILMEFIPHGDLYRHLHKTIASISEFHGNLRLRVALDVATGMRYLHGQGLVHRDLRSPNVFIVSLDHTAPIVAKVADFGLAQYVAGSVSGSLLNWRWLPPETWSASASYNEKADVWSFGVILWELVTGKVPFEDEESKTKAWDLQEAIAQKGLRLRFRPAATAAGPLLASATSNWSVSPSPSSPRVGLTSSAPGQGSVIVSGSTIAHSATTSWGVTPTVAGGLNLPSPRPVAATMRAAPSRMPPLNLSPTPTPPPSNPPLSSTPHSSSMGNLKSPPKSPRRGTDVESASPRLGAARQPRSYAPA